MDNEKFIGVLDALIKKLSEGQGLFSFWSDTVFFVILMQVQKRVVELKNAVVKAGESQKEIMDAIGAYGTSSTATPEQLDKIKDDEPMKNILKNIPIRVSEGIKKIKSQPGEMYAVIQSTMNTIGTEIESYKNANAVKQKLVRSIGDILKGTAHEQISPPSSNMKEDNRTLMLACTANVVEIFENVPGGFPYTDTVTAIHAALKQFRVEIAAGKSPKEAMTGYKAATEKVNTELESLDNKNLKETLKGVHALADKISSSHDEGADSMNISFKYMGEMGVLIQKYDGIHSDYFHSIGKAMIVQDAGKVRLALNIDKLISKLRDQPKGFSDDMRNMITATIASLETFKNGSATNFNAAVEQHRKDTDKMRALLEALPENQLAQTILSVYVLLESSKTPENNPLQMFRFMTAFGAILDTYDGEYSDYIREIGQIMGYTGTKDCITTCAIAGQVMTHEPFHLEWQAIHRITSILHSMQHE